MFRLHEARFWRCSLCHKLKFGLWKCATFAITPIKNEEASTRYLAFCEKCFTSKVEVKTLLREIIRMDW